jgi:hypothetical protein
MSRAEFFNIIIVPLKAISINVSGTFEIKVCKKEKKMFQEIPIKLKYVEHEYLEAKPIFFQS